MSRLVTSLFILLPVVCYGIISDNVTVRKNEFRYFLRQIQIFGTFLLNLFKNIFQDILEDGRVRRYLEDHKFPYVVENAAQFYRWLGYS